MTLGSLFDGIGTWQLAAARAGITPLWSSEVEKFPRNVTARHFPKTIQLGDINQITALPKVDIVTAGSPCQDLSIAGARQGGIHGERSSLFFRAIELVRQLEPRFFVWENVPHALHMHGGMDFKTVLEEILQATIPIPKCGFSNAGLVDGKRGQAAWRVCDAQYWGVPQRRRRVFLVADFRGRRAGEILFEPQSMRGNSAQSEGEKQIAAARTGNITDCAVYMHSWKNARIKKCATAAPTVATMYGTGGLNTPLVAYGIGRDAFSQGTNALFKPQIECELQPTLTTRGGAAVAKKIVRRLTPLECERLQGLPDNWTEGGSDSARYRAIGNGMALPIAEWILKRIKEGQ